MAATTQDLRDWIARRYHDYSLSTEPVIGTYGLVWFLSSAFAPRGFAVKSVAPERVASCQSAMDGEYLRREFRMWLELPPTYNVLSALGFDEAVLGRLGDDSATVPVMRMPRMDGSLQEWVGAQEPSVEDRLIALAQAFNGLIYLYERGFQGHGDLKPSNLLYANMRNRYSEFSKTGWPSDGHPWRICVADLGWADAWLDLGFSTKALRQYLAPERIDDHVAPAQSDVFSMGVIAAELLQGHHPAPNLKAACQSEGKWVRWVKDGARNLDGIASVRIRNLIAQCLAADPTKRPTPFQCLTEICDELGEAYGLEIAATLEYWRKPVSDVSSIGEDEHLAWAARQWLRSSGQEARLSRKQLETRLSEIDVVDFATCERWAILAGTIMLLLQSEGRDEASSIDRLQDAARSHLRIVLGQMSRTRLEGIRARSSDPVVLQTFERFSDTVRRIADIASLIYENAGAGDIELNPLALSALAFSFAASGRTEGCRPEIVDHYLAEAIRYAPEEAVPHFFRASWLRERLFATHDRDHQSTTDTDAVVLGELEIACRLSPQWSEPKELLERLRRKDH